MNICADFIFKSKQRLSLIEATTIVFYGLSSGSPEDTLHSLEQMKEYHVMTSGQNLLSADEQEDRLWIASQRYMLGEIGVEDLEKEELPHSLKLRRAEIALAKLKPEWAPRTTDEHEDHLWRASRRYMLGEISIAELEDIERPHAHNLRKAIMEIAESRLRWHFHLRWGFLLGFFERDRKHL